MYHYVLIWLSVCFSVYIFSQSYYVNERNDDFFTGSSDWRQLTFDVHNWLYFSLTLSCFFCWSITGSYMIFWFYITTLVSPSYTRMSYGKLYFWLKLLLPELAFISQVLSMDQSSKVIFELPIITSRVPSCSLSTLLYFDYFLVSRVSISLLDFLYFPCCWWMLQFACPTAEQCC